MTKPLNISFEDPSTEAIAEFDGAIVAFMGEDGTMDALAKRVNRQMKGALVRLGESDGFAKGNAGHVTALAFPAGLSASLVLVVKLSRRASVADARLAGAAIAKALKGQAGLVLAEGEVGALKAEVLALGRMLDRDQTAGTQVLDLIPGIDSTSARA